MAGVCLILIGMGSCMMYNNKLAARELMAELEALEGEEYVYEDSGEYKTPEQIYEDQMDSLRASAPEYSGEAQSRLADQPDLDIDGVAKKIPADIFARVAQSEAEREKRDAIIIGFADGSFKLEQNSMIIDDVEYADMLDAITDENPRKITMPAVAVKQHIVKSSSEYEKFKKASPGNYPNVDFKKQTLFVLETDDNLPNNIIQIAEVKAEGKKAVVWYIVNPFGLKIRDTASAHTLLDKNITEVEVKQVM
ncbi:hypothetical protein Dip518_001471 [Parelusimicrobium proximum]